MEQLLEALSHRAWPLAVVLALLLVTRALKSPSLGAPLARVPVRLRPHVVALLGVASAVLDAIARGTPWLEALTAGATATAWAVFVHGLLGGIDPPNPDKGAP